MLNALVGFSLRRKGVVLVLAALLLVWGGSRAMHSELDVLPDFAAPQVVVQTEAPGFSAEQVETLVTRRLEAVLCGANDVDSVRSQSIEGLSVITIVFADDVDPYRARQAISERISGVAPTLPDGVEPPQLTPLVSATMDVLKIGLRSERLSPAELRTFAQWTLRPRLLVVPGVASGTLFGGEVSEIQIQVDPQRLEALDLTLQDVVAAARDSTGVRGVGFVEGANQRIVLEANGELHTAAELAQVVVARRAGRSVLLSDVARVVDAAAPRFGDALVQGRPGVLLTMLSQYGANTMEVTRGLESALADLAPLFEREGIELFPRLHRPATFVENSIANLSHTLWLGAALVAAVLFLFLRNVRSAFISIITIPLSLIAAVVVLQRFGSTLNTMTLGGLAIALGEVVDDSIIDVENISRRLRLNALDTKPRRAIDVVLAASLEVRAAVVFATCIVALAFVPVLTLSGLQGRLFAPLGLAYVLAVVASLLVALTVTPALCLLLLARHADDVSEWGWLVAVRARYGRVLEKLVRHRKIVFALAACACALAAWLVPRLEFEFLPAFREGHFVVHVTAAPGTSLEEMKRLGAGISARWLADERVATVEQQIGRAALGEDPWSTNRSEFHVEVRSLPAAEEERVAQSIRSVLESTPGIRHAVLTFLGDRIEETISGETAQFVVEYFGDDQDAIESCALAAAHELEAVAGSADVSPGIPPATPTQRAFLHLDRLAEFGVRPGEVLAAAHAAFQGEVVAQVRDGGATRNVVVALDPLQRRDPEQLGDLRVRNADGARVRLADLADVRLESTRTMLSHEGGRRRATVSCNVDGRGLTEFAADATQRVKAAVALPPGVYAEFGGAAAQERSARIELLWRAGFMLAAVIGLCMLALRHARNVALVLANVPFALSGGIAAAWLSGEALSLGSVVGFVTLFGLTLRNSIMLVSHYDHLVVHEGATWSLATVVRGAQERFAPIVMTATVTGLGLLPLALSGGAGREIESPMARVILGGLLTSTVLNVLVLPGLAWQWGAFRRSELRED